MRGSPCTVVPPPNPPPPPPPARAGTGVSPEPAAALPPPRPPRPRPPPPPPVLAAAAAPAPPRPPRPCGESAPAFSPGPVRMRTSCPAVPATNSISETSLGARTSPIGVRQALQAKTTTLCVSGSYDPPGQLVPPDAVPSVKVASGPPALLSTGGVKTGPIL